MLCVSFDLVAWKPHTHWLATVYIYIYIHTHIHIHVTLMKLGLLTSVVVQVIKRAHSACRSRELPMNKTPFPPMKLKWPLHSNYIQTYKQNHCRYSRLENINPGQNVAPVLLDYGLGADSRKCGTL